MADDATFEKYFPQKESSITPKPVKPKPGLSPYEEYFGKKPTTPSIPKPDYYDVISISPEEAQKRRDSAAKSKAEITALYGPYNKALPAYRHNAERHWEFFNNNPNVGYKFHLNVLPENVRVVADFLRRHDYKHKYLSGGEVEDGKVFTVYTGSKEQTEQIVKETYDHIGSLLQPSTKQDYAAEVPYAPNIVGRFCGESSIYESHISVNGVEVLKKDFGFKDRKFQIMDPQGAFERAHKVALERYGDYYGGGIKYYKPQNTG